MSNAASCIGQEAIPFAASSRSMLLDFAHGLMWDATRSLLRGSDRRAKPQNAH